MDKSKRKSNSRFFLDVCKIVNKKLQKKRIFDVVWNEKTLKIQNFCETYFSSFLHHFRASSSVKSSGFFFSKIVWNWNWQSARVVITENWIRFESNRIYFCDIVVTIVYTEAQKEKDEEVKINDEKIHLFFFFFGNREWQFTEATIFFFYFLNICLVLFSLLSPATKKKS